MFQGRNDHKNLKLFNRDI